MLFNWIVINFVITGLHSYAKAKRKKAGLPVWGDDPISRAAEVEKQ